MSAIAELTLKKETSRGRKSLSPSVRVNYRLGVKFGPQGDHIGTESLFQLSKQSGSFDVFLAKLFVWKFWIANRILRAEDRSDWVCSSCRRKIRALHQCYLYLCQVPCLVVKTRRVKVTKRDSSSRFNRCLPTSVSSPYWIPLGRKIQRHVRDNVADEELAVDRQEGQ